MTRLSPWERLMLLVVAATCLAFAVLTPPFQAPDEPQHLSRSWSIAHGRLFAERRGAGPYAAVGGLEPQGYARLSERDFPREPFEVATRYTPGKVPGAMRRLPGDDAPVFVEFANVASYAPTMYVPQAIGLLAGETAGLPPLGCFYVARLLNALAFLLLLWGAVRAMPFGRPALLAVAALPTVAYQAASVSPDATIMGVGWLAIALSLRLGFGGGRGARALGLAAVPLGLAKGLYAPLTLAGITRSTLLRHLACFAVAAVAFGLWTKAAGGDQPLYKVVSRTTGELVTTAPLSAQLHVVLAAPLHFVGILVTDLAERSPVYLLQLAGRFGWNAVLLPLAAYPLALAMLAAGVGAGLGRPVPPVFRLWWALVGIGGVLLVEAALYLTGTPLDADFVQGTQGRYFLPLLPLFALAIAPAAGWRIDARRLTLGAAVLLDLVAVATVVDAFWIHGFTVHHGLPPIAHDAGGLARALLLPSPRW